MHLLESCLASYTPGSAALAAHTSTLTTSASRPPLARRCHKAEKFCATCRNGKEVLQGLLSGTPTTERGRGLQTSSAWGRASPV